MKLEDALAAIARAAGLNTLAFDQAGVCRLMFDQKRVVDIERLDGHGHEAYLYAVVGPVPAQDREALYADLLGANLFGRETGEAVLALDAVAGEVLLQQKVDVVDMDESRFVSLVEAFVHTLEHWQDRFEQGAPSSATAYEPPSDAPMMRV